MDTKDDTEDLEWLDSKELPGVETRYLGPTDRLGSRIAVRWCDGISPRRITYHYRDDLSLSRNHHHAALRFVAEWAPGCVIRSVTWTDKGYVYGVRLRGARRVTTTEDRTEA